jgi:hypothetical protein
MFQRYVTGMMDEISYLLMGFYVFRTCSIWMIYTQCVCSPMVEQDERVGHASSMVVSMNESVIWIGLWNIYRCYRSLIALLRSCQSLHVQPTTLLAREPCFFFSFSFVFLNPPSLSLGVVGREPEVCHPQPLHLLVLWGDSQKFVSPKGPWQFAVWVCVRVFRLRMLIVDPLKGG